MPTKNTANPQKAHEQGIMNEWKWLFKWLFILGGIATGVVNVLAANPDFSIPGPVLWASVGIGVLVGIFYFESDDLINIGLRFMIFSAAARTLPSSSETLSYIAAFFLGFSFFLGPVVLTLVVVYFVKKYILNKG